jgi:hypothetical protein
MTISFRWIALLIFVATSACFFLVVLFFTTSEGKRSLSDNPSQYSASDTNRGAGNGISRNGFSDDSSHRVPTTSQHLSAAGPSYLDGSVRVAPGTILREATNSSSQDSSPVSPLRPNASPVVITGDRSTINSSTARSDGTHNQSQANTQSTISPANRPVSGITEIPTPVSGLSIDTSSAVAPEQTARSAGMGGVTLGSTVNGVGADKRSVSVTGSEISPTTAGYPEVETPQQYQTQFGDSAYSKAVTDRMIEESNQGKP